jgi:hypothetical protein
MKTRSNGPSPASTIGGDVLLRHLRVVRIGLERDQAAVVGQRARQPDRREAAERPDLEDALRLDHARQQVQQLACDRFELDCRQAFGRTSLERTAEGIVDRDDAIADPPLDLVPARIVHAGTGSGANVCRNVKA